MPEFNDHPTLHWEATSCDWCGSSESTLFFQGPDRQENLPGVFTMVRCNQCSVFRQNPSLAWESLQHYYPEGYASHPILVREEQTFLRRLDKRYGPWKRLRAIQSLQPGGNLLEVGCGTGLFLEEALRSGRWQVTGIEPSSRAAEYAQSHLKAPIHNGRFSDIDLPPRSFDVVALWNVLEHLSHPYQDLQRARHLLKPGGWLVFAVPNFEGLESKIFGPLWLGWELPRHLYVFPKPALEAGLERLGFRMAQTRCISTSYSVLGYSLDFWSKTWGELHPRLRRLLMRSYFSLPARVALVPPLALQDRLKLSTILTYFAQKTDADD